MERVKQEAAKTPVPWRITAQNRTHLDFNSETEKQWKGSFYFIQGADCQFGLIERYLEKKPEPGWEKECQLSELAVACINRLKPKPKFFVICGDLCDAFADATPELREAQERDLKRIFNKLNPDIPLVCICGNHDVGDNPTVKTVDRYVSTFGDDYFSFWAGGVFFIALNSQFYFAPELVPDLVVAQDAWLEKQLEVARSSQHPVVIFQHIPWFLSDPDSTEFNYFEVRHDMRKKMLDKFIDAGVGYVFCGHYHRNAGGKYKSLEVVTTSAIGAQLGNDKSGMRVVKVHTDRVTHEYFLFEDFPENVTIE